MRTFLMIIILSLILGCNLKQNDSINKKLKYKDCNCLIDILEPNDTMRIGSEFRGCFHHSLELIKIYRHSDSLFADLIVHVLIKDKKISLLRHLLSQNSVLAFGEFVREGKKLTNAGTCTSTKSFIIKLNGDSLKFADNACNFNGYNRLKDSLFGKSIMEKFENKIYN